MTATVPGGIGAVLNRWKRKILAVHAFGEEEQRSPGTTFSKVSVLPLGFCKCFVETHALSL
jgi:hypothetical protein